MFLIIAFYNFCAYVDVFLYLLFLDRNILNLEIFLCVCLLKDLLAVRDGLLQLIVRQLAMLL